MATYNAAAAQYAYSDDATWHALTASARVFEDDIGWLRFTGASAVLAGSSISSATLTLSFASVTAFEQLRIRGEVAADSILPTDLSDAINRTLTVGSVTTSDLNGLTTIAVDVLAVITALRVDIDGDVISLKLDDPNYPGTHVAIESITASLSVDYTPAGPSETVAETEIAEIVLAVGEATATRERSASVEIAEISLAVADATATTARLASVEVAELRLDVATAAATTARIAAVEIAEMSLAVGDATATREVIAETEVAEIVLSVATELTAVTAQVVAVEVAELRLDVAGATATTPRIASIEIADLQLATAAATATLPVEATTEVAELRLSVPGGNPVHAWGEVRLSFSARAASAS